MLQFNHFNFNVLDLEKSLSFYKACLSYCSDVYISFGFLFKFSVLCFQNKKKSFYANRKTCCTRRLSTAFLNKIVISSAAAYRALCADSV